MNQVQWPLDQNRQLPLWQKYRSKWRNTRIKNQCITVCQRTVRYPFLHYKAIFLCSFSMYHSGILCFFHVALSSYGTFLCCNLFMLHHFQISLFCVWLFPSCTFFILYDFHFVSFSYIELFQVALFHVAMFSFCILLLLHT